MAERKTKYYSCTGGLTVGMAVCADGEVLAESAFGFNDDNKPLTENEQRQQYGKVMYREVDPDPVMLAAIRSESARIMGLNGMQSPEHPPVISTPVLAEGDLATMSRGELRRAGKRVGLNFGADMDRERMVSAIQKRREKLGEAASEDKETQKALQSHRQKAKQWIETANDAGAGKGKLGMSPAEEDEPKTAAVEEGTVDDEEDLSDEEVIEDDEEIVDDEEDEEEVTGG